MPGVWSNAYYLPSHVIPEITTVISLFRKHEMYVDLAVPTAIYCLIKPEEIEPMQNFQLVAPTAEKQLTQYFNFFQCSNDHLMHPTKWGLLEEHSGYAQLFCTQVVPFVHHGQ